MHKCQECKHEKVTYCPKCLKVYCEECGRVWENPCTRNHNDYWVYPYYPYVKEPYEITYYGTTCSTGDYDYTICSH